MQALVVDASVLIKIFSHDPSELYLTQVEKFLQDWESLIKSGHVPQVLIPSLAILEIINALSKSKKTAPDRLSSVSANLWQLGFTIIELSPELTNLTATIMCRDNLTSYDAVYLALAQLSNTHLLSADRHHTGEQVIKLADYIGFPEH